MAGGSVGAARDQPLNPAQEKETYPEAQAAGKPREERVNGKIVYLDQNPV